MTCNSTVGTKKIRKDVFSMLKTVDFCGTEVTRLTIGNNPFSGHSYITDIVSGEEMMDYYTADKITEALFAAEEAGINTYQALACPFILRVLRQYRNEGGKLKIIFQTYPAIDLRVNLRQMLAWEPFAIYHQGTMSDFLMESGETEKLKENLKLIRETGVKVGFATHVPETVLQAEKEGWDVDFYMTCLYNARRTQRGQTSGFITGKEKRLVFYPEDRFLMFDAIRKVKKPCIAFKLLAGGQVFYGKTPEQYPQVISDVFTETFSNIKPGDIATVGVYQKNANQIKEDAMILERVLNTL